MSAVQTTITEARLSELALAALNRLGSWAPDAVRLRKILVENPARLYGF